MTALYIDFPKKACPNMSSPCWIPQADNIIDKDIISALPQCDTIEKYRCMLTTVLDARATVNRECITSCYAESHKMLTSRNALEPFPKVS